MPAGLFLHCDKACFGASPNRLLECVFCGKGVLEVEDDSLDASMVSAWFYLATKFTRNSVLKHGHSYLYQCQMQIAVTDTTHCDFMVWSPSGICHTERIILDEKFMKETPKDRKLFWLAITLDLLVKWYSREY